MNFSIKEIPYIEVSNQDRKRLLEYIDNFGEAAEEIAFLGPSHLCDQDPDYLLFWLISAYDLLHSDPTNGFHYHYLANAFLAKGDVDSALKVLDVLAKQKMPFMAFYDDPYFHIALIKADCCKYDEAIRAFENCQSRFPESEKELAFYIGRVHHSHGYFQKAVEYYRKCLLGFGKHPSKEKAHVEQFLSDAKSGKLFDGRHKKQWVEFIN